VRVTRKNVLQTHEDEKVLELATGMSKLDTATNPTGAQLQPRQGINRDGIRVGERSHVADDGIAIAPREHLTGALAQGRDVLASHRAAEDHVVARARLARFVVCGHPSGETGWSDGTHRLDGPRPMIFHRCVCLNL
jgi:hypothetical protein